MNRILIIDDELGISELICEALQRAGYAVAAAFNGRQGIQCFDEAVFDLVVTDMGLPDMDGKGVVRHIRASSRPFTPVIGISGTPWLLQGAACDAILPKPFPLQALARLVKRLTQLGLANDSLPMAFSINDQPAV